MAAVPKWTGMPPITGHRLAVLIGLWIVGRIGMAIPVLEGLDLLFLPVFATFILLDVVRVRNVRNYQVPAMLFGLAALNTYYHFGDASLALRASIYLITGLIALIGGRIVPAFTQSGLRMAGIDITATTPPILDTLAVPAVALVVLTELVLPGTVWSGSAALAAAIILGARMVGWHTLKTGPVPLVWILHAGYVWVPVGYLLKAASDIAGLYPASAAMHALTAGAIGVMILAVGSRAALGHSGRPLMATRPTVVAYWLVLAGAVTRVFVPTPVGTEIGGLLWCAGYAVFAITYWPILTKPRIDGLPG
jgi:uncharacterized protein involved in response to NO